MNRAYYPTLMSLTIKLQHTAYYGNMGCHWLDEDYTFACKFEPWCDPLIDVVITC